MNRAVAIAADAGQRDSFGNVALPADWSKIELGELFDIQQGQALAPRHRKGKSPRPFLRTANVLWGRLELSTVDRMDFDDEDAARLSLRKGDLLVCEGGEVGRTAIWQDEIVGCSYQNHLHRLRTRREDVLPEFYMYWMQVAVLFLGLYGGAENRTTIPNLSKNRLGHFHVPLPSLAEQRAITSMLRVAQQAKEATEKVIDATRQLKRSLIDYFFTYGPVPIPETRNVTLKQTDIGPIPEHWTVRYLSDFATTTSGGTPNRARPEYYGGGIPWVKSGELRDGLVTRTEETLTPLGLANSSAKLFHPGTLLVAMYGATAGKVGILQIEASTNQAVCAISPRRDIVDSRFLFYALTYRREALLGARYGGAQPNISQTVLRNFELPLPPVADQRLIARVLGSLDEKLTAETSRAKALTQTFNALLGELMLGRRRVPARGSDDG